MEELIVEFIQFCFLLIIVVGAIVLNLWMLRTFLSTILPAVIRLWNDEPPDMNNKVDVVIHKTSIKLVDILGKLLKK